jgi:hypothetical protein
MKAVLTEEKATVYGSTDEHSISIATIHKGELLELGKVVRKGGKLFEKKPLRGGLWYPKLNLFYTEKVWVEITLPGDQKGYIEGNTSIFAVKKAALYSKTADLLETANKNGFVIKTLKDGAILTVIGIDKTEEGSWFKVTDENGVTGYLLSTAKLKEIPMYNRDSAKKNMITGLAFLILGGGVAIFNIQSSQSDNTIMLYIAYAIIFFGILQGGQGLAEFVRARRSKDPSKQ